MFALRSSFLFVLVQARAFVRVQLPHNTSTSGACGAQPKALHRFENLPE
jgi:hypothetical protein